MRSLLWFLPDAFMPLVVIVAAVGLIVGALRPRGAASLVGSIVLTLILGPFIEGFFATLPAWVGVAVLLLAGFFLARWILTALLGEHGAGHVIGAGAIGVIRLAARLALMPIKILLWASRALYRSIVLRV